jgi:hypothetical protein
VGSEYRAFDYLGQVIAADLRLAADRDVIGG